MNAAAPSRQRPRAGPYIVPRPAIISFSGGRTSSYMLKHIVDAHRGRLPAETTVVFANTGMERPETLDFIDTCARAWSIDIVWAELDWAAPHRTRIVDYATAFAQRRTLRRPDRAQGIFTECNDEILFFVSQTRQDRRG